MDMVVNRVAQESWLVRRRRSADSRLALTENCLPLREISALGVSLPPVYDNALYLGLF